MRDGRLKTKTVQDENIWRVTTSRATDCTKPDRRRPAESKFDRDWRDERLMRRRRPGDFASRNRVVGTLAATRVAAVRTRVVMMVGIGRSSILS